MPSHDFKLSVAMFFFIFIVSASFSVQAGDYINNDLSSNVTDATDYNDATVINSRTLSSGSVIGGYLYLGGIVSGNVNITNNGSVTSTHSNYGVFYLPYVGNASTTKTVSVTNDGALETTGTYAIPIYILSRYDGSFPGPTVARSFDFQLNNSDTITSAAGAIDIRNGDSGSFVITNSGTISSSTTSSVLKVIELIGNNATITNSGTIQASSSERGAIEVIGDNFTLNILNGSNIVGTITAGGSNNILNVKKNVTVTELDALYNQLVGTWKKNIYSGSTLTIGSGESASIASSETFATVALSSGGSITNSGTLSALSVSGSGNVLTLASGSSSGDISNSGALEVSSGSSNITYSGIISGNGSITKTGSGRLELDGTNTYSGATIVSAGELKVNGSTASSATTIASGATISGTGTVGALTIQSGGTLSPGNSPGTLNISGNLDLNSGSITNFEFTSSVIDKIIATGNIAVAGTANFQLYGADGYFTVSQDILQSTGGTISGTFDTITTDNGFSTNLTYGSSAVHAVISKTLNSNALDGVLSSQNSVGRLINKSLTDQLRNSQYLDKKTTAWINGGGFGSYMAANGNSAAYLTNGYLNSAGLIHNNGDLQVVVGLFNSQANVKRFTYSGKDDIDSNGFALGLGKNFHNNLGNLYAFTQVGAGFYGFDTRRNVNINGSYEVGRGSGNGGFQYLGIGGAQTIPTNLSGELGIFTSATLQKTQHDGWHEAGLSTGNLDISHSSADTLNLEFGTSYKNDLPKFLRLKKDSFYKFELTGYKSDLYSKKSAIVTDNAVRYGLNPTYNQRLTLGASAFFLIPVLENSAITSRFDRRENGISREFIATVGYVYEL